MEKPTIEVLEERVSNWMESTTEYRKDLCRKIDIITTKLSDLPCKERKEIYDNFKMVATLIWGGLGITFAILIFHLGWK